MKASEKKIKQAMPFEDVPAYLRLLADAVEKNSDNLPAELADLPEPIAKLEMKGKVRNGTWELKIKIKAETAPSPELPLANDLETRPASESPRTKPGIKYKSLKKRMKSSFKNIAEALKAQKLPESDIMDTFLADSELMTTFAGAKYGEAHYQDYRDACRRLADAYATKNWEAFKAGYAALDQLKKDCHSSYK